MGTGTTGRECAFKAQRRRLSLSGATIRRNERANYSTRAISLAFVEKNEERERKRELKLLIRRSRITSPQVAAIKVNYTNMDDIEKYKLKPELKPN